MAATKYSDTMTTALRVMAGTGRTSAAIAQGTIDALVRREAIVSQHGGYSHGLVVQLTAAGWAALSADGRDAALSDAHDEALATHHERMTITRDRFAHTLRMLAAPSDARWVGRRHGEYRSGLDAETDYAATCVSYGPWFGLDYAREGLAAAIRDERDAMMARYHVDNRIVVRLSTLLERFNSDPNALSVSYDGLTFSLHTNDVDTDSRVDLVHAYALANLPAGIRVHVHPHAIGEAVVDLASGTHHTVIGTEWWVADRNAIPATEIKTANDSRIIARSSAFERADRYLLPMTSVVDAQGNSGRVQWHNGDGRVAVRWHGKPRGEETLTHRGDLMTTAELWADLADEAAIFDQVFYLRASAQAAHDPLCRYLGWFDHMTKGQSGYPYSCATIAEDSDELIRFVMLASYGDYSQSSTADASNYRVFCQRYSAGHRDPLAYGVGPNERDGLGIAVRVGDPRWSIDQVAALASSLRAVHQYPLLDEEDHSAYETELAEQWWTGCGESDTHSLVDELLSKSSTVDSNGDPYTWETARIDQSWMAEYVRFCGEASDDRETVIHNALMRDGEYRFEFESQSATEVAVHDFAGTVDRFVGDAFALVRHVARLPRHSGKHGTTCPSNVFATKLERETGRCVVCGSAVTIEYRTPAEWSEIDNAFAAGQMTTDEL